MCVESPQMPAEYQTLRCWAIGTLTFGILTLIGFLIPPYIGAIGGFLAVIGSSLVICCGSRDPKE